MEKIKQGFITIVNFTLEEELDICQQYIMGKTTTELSKQFGCSRGPITRCLREYNITPQRRKHYFNEHIFDIIDSKAKAYWLGFIAGDGNVRTNKRNVLKIELARKDEEQLHKFIKFMGCATTIVKTCRNNVFVSFNSAILIASLVDKGITPRKSLTLKFPTKVPSNLLPSYILGILDADGCCYTSPRGYFQLSFASGSPKFITQLRDELHSRGFHKTQINKRKNAILYSIRYNDANGLKLAHYLRDDDLGMTRKTGSIPTYIGWRGTNVIIKDLN